MSKTISILALIAVSVPMLVFGDAINPGTTPPASPVTSVSDINTFVCKIFNILFYFLIFLAVVFVLYAAFKYLTSGGDSAKVGEASKMLLFAAVAVVVALIARGVPAIVSSLFSSGLSSFSC